MITVVGEFTQECLGISVKRSPKAVDAQKSLVQLMKERGQPCYLCSEMGLNSLKEKSLRKWLKEKGGNSIFIDSYIYLNNTN
jgi:hypothetical protein